MKPFLNDTVQAAVVNDKEDVMDTAEGSLLMNDGSYSNGISELEQMLMQKTLTRSEIVHLTELLKSKEAGVSSGDSLKERNVSASDYGKHQMLAGGFVGGNISGGRLSASTSTPFRQFKVPADDVASPAELAKNYMGSRGSKVSPSMLGVQRNYSREDSEFRNNGASASKSLFVPSTEKKSISSDAIKNDFTTPRSRGRSAIYDMARTPYSRNHSSLKGLQFNNENGNTGAAASYSASLYLKEKNDEIYESRNLKRRSSVLDGEVGYIGPVRRIRQKSNLLAPPVSHIPLRVGSNAKQNLEMIGEPRILGQNENQDSPSTSYAHVPPKSSEMAAKILKQLEKLSPAEKLLESQSALGLKKSKLSLTASMLSGKALRSMEAIESPKMLLDFQDEKKSPDLTKKYLPDEDGTLLQKPGNKAKELPRESVSPSDTQNGALLSQPFMTGSKNATSGTENGASLPSQTNRAFKMSAKEDSFELDDDFHSTGDTFRNFSEAPGVVEPSSSSCNVLSSEDVKITTNESGFILPSVLTSSKAHVIRPLSSSEIPERSSVALPASNEPPGIASQSSSLPPSVEKPKEANDPTLVLSSTSKVDTFPSPSSKFAEEAESRKESPIRLELL
ncbi:hypothetical protein M569_07306 [Genlisea aurea]|uniref:Uncharacterized protein n=1 Tax=Genlisea aurea TaxID=192259 RepID=S8CJW3_9LAMI|nr:hypothetical protein M569_07306 [Genlisea aurea]